MATTLRTSGITMGSSTLDVSGSAPSFTARAFVCFDGGAAGVRASGNVSSLTNTAAGDHLISFTTALADSDYAAVYDAPQGAPPNSGTSCGSQGTRNSSSCRLRMCQGVNNFNAGFIGVAYFR